MAYTPINWQIGDTITAEKLNRCDNGWAVESTTLFSETVTTEAGEYGNEGMLAYGSQVTAPSITVTFGGTDYQCSAVKVGNSYGYGGVDDEWEYDFTTYPFALVSTYDENVFATQTAGTYAVSATAQGVEASDDFSVAVNACFDFDASAMPLQCVSGTTTYAEMERAYKGGHIMFFRVVSLNTFSTYFVTGLTSSSVTFIPEAPNMTASFVNGVFTLSFH